MKKILFVIICVIGLVSFSSCRSTSKPCGLAENITTSQIILLETTEVI